MKRGKQQRRLSLFDPSQEDARFRRRQLDNATMFIHDPVLIECFDIVAHLMAFPEAEPFNEPVDWEALQLPSYPSIIKNPMDLGTVKELLLDSSVDTHERFAELVRLVFSNAQLFNLQGSPIWMTSKSLADEFERVYEELQSRHRIGRFTVLDGSGYLPPSPSGSHHTLSAPSSSKRQKARPQSPAPYPSTPPAYGGAYDSDADIQQLEDQIRSLEGTIEHFKKEIAEERAKQERAAEEAKNRPPKRIKLSRPLRPVTFQERQDLVYKIPNLDQADLPELLDIVRLATAQKADSDEIEIDIENMDDRTFRKVEEFVNSRLASRQQQAMDVVPNEQEEQQQPQQHEDKMETDTTLHQPSDVAAAPAPVTEAPVKSESAPVEPSAAMDVEPAAAVQESTPAPDEAPAPVEPAVQPAEPASDASLEPKTEVKPESAPVDQAPAPVPSEETPVSDVPISESTPAPETAVETTQVASEPSPAAAESEAFSADTHVPPPVSSTPSEHSEAEDGPDAMDVDQAPQHEASESRPESDTQSASALAALAAVSTGADAMDTS